MPQRLVRPPAGASPELRAQFGRALLAALDLIGVERGEEFYVTKTAGEAHARRSDPATSKQAAASVADLRATQMALLQVFAQMNSPLSDEQLVAAYERRVRRGEVPAQSQSGIRSRRAELARGGLLVDTGKRGKTARGRQTILWGLPPLMASPASALAEWSADAQS